MEFEEQPLQSCWRVAAYTVLVLGAVIAAAYLFGGFETTIAIADAG